MNKHLISKAALTVCKGMGALADFKLPKIVLEPAIKAYSLGFGVNAGEAKKPECGYGSFGDFFARELKDGARAICSDEGCFVSPCDGKIAAVQDIRQNSANRFLVKGFNYNINQLLGDDVQDRFAGGAGMVIYLHPRDYHRVHTPQDISLTSVRHIPGTRFPVASWSEEWVSGIYQRNERVVFNCKVNGGDLSLVMVSAFGVGHIASPYCPPVGDHSTSLRVFENGETLNKGQELGAFRLGSTVVMLWSKELIEMVPELDLGKVVLGQKLGTCKVVDVTEQSLE